MQLHRQSNQKPILLDSEALGGGGEGRIHRVMQDSTLAAKVYHRAEDAPASKLAVMVANPPSNPPSGQGQVSIAWPVDLLADGNRRVVGFLMPLVLEMRPVFEFYTPQLRATKCPLFDYKYLHHAARNLAASVYALHASGYVIGDIKEVNTLVSDTAWVTLVDTDSFQVRDPKTGMVYRCPVGTPEFTPPELQGRSFPDIDRAPEHDLFGLAALIFQLLMEGVHPFAGRYAGKGDPPEYRERISAGHFPYSARSVPYSPKTTALPLGVLHPDLQRLFARCFEDGHNDPKARPGAQEWQTTLDRAESALTACSANGQHRYGSHLNACPWCERIRLFGVQDPFPSPQAVQSGSYRQPARPVPTQPQPVRPTTTPPPAPAPAPVRAWFSRVVGGLARGVPMFGCLFVLALAGWGGYRAYNNFAGTSAQATSSPQPAVVPPPFIASDRTKTNPKDGAVMVFIPAGEFLMGSEEADDEKPQRKVYLDGYWMYKREVTVAQYRKFCSATGREMPSAPSWGWKDDHPIVNVSWEDARAYCAWAGGRLPTEAEWEKAARGTDGRKYPWGSEWDAGKCANSVGNRLSGTAAVGSYPQGASPYGVLDMAGNVWEWCADWYDQNYYQRAPDRNPPGPETGEARVLRGGSWHDSDPGYFRTADRLRYIPTAGFLYIGFRVAHQGSD